MFPLQTLDFALDPGGYVPALSEELPEVIAYCVIVLFVLHDLDCLIVRKCHLKGFCCDLSIAASYHPKRVDKTAYRAIIKMYQNRAQCHFIPSAFIYNELQLTLVMTFQMDKVEQLVESRFHALPVSLEQHLRR